MGNRKQSILDTVISVVALMACIFMLAIAIRSNDAVTMVVLLSIGLVIGTASVATVVNMVKRCIEHDDDEEEEETVNTVIERHSDPTDLPPSYEECVATSANTNTIGITSISHRVDMEARGRGTVAIDIDIQDLHSDNRIHNGCQDNEGFEYDEPPPPSYQEALALKERAQSVLSSTSV
ncbi:uncharacterized protein LOC144359407 [Saccoglossus kowalevskii]